MPITSYAFQFLQAWIRYPRLQAVLIQKIVDRIRNSLELQVVLQTAADEVASLLNLDSCSFLWYFKDTQRVQVVCEWNSDQRKTSQLGYYPLESFGAIASALVAGEQIVNNGIVPSKPKLLSLGLLAQQFPWQPFPNWLKPWRNKKRQQSSNVLGANRPSVRQESHLSEGMDSLAGLPLIAPDKRIGKALLRASGELTTQEENRLYANHPVLGYRASVLIPVTATNEGIGFIACFSEQRRRWSAGEIKFLESIAEPLEIAIRQAKLYEKTQKQAIRERLVNQITRQTRQSFDPEIILTEAIAQLLEVLEADRCLVHLVEDLNNPEIIEANSERPTTFACGAFRRKHIYEVCRQPFSPSLEDFDINGPITQWVIQHRQLVMIPDITQDERIGKANPEYQKTQIKSSLVIPVQANGKLHALLYINQCSQTRYWSKNDQQLAEAVADQLAISLQQAYLYTCTQQQAAHSALQAQKMAEMIEELRLTQAQLIQSEKMSSLGRMVAGVAHEINNPVGFIYGNIPYVENYVSDLIRLVQAYQAYYPHPPDRIQQLTKETEIDFLLRDLPKILKSMESGAERIHEIVQLLQKFSGTNSTPVKLVDLNAALESTLLILHSQLVGTIQVEREYDSLPPVECYPKQINQAFLSTLTNAIEALNRMAEPTKVITLRTKWVPSLESGQEGRVQIAIADNGPGIPPEIQPRIFEPFFTTKDVGQGRGLGLTVTYQTIVNQHHGQIDCQSQLGQGTTFLIEIPVKHPQSLTSEPSSYMGMTTTMPQAKSSALSRHSVAAATNSGC